MKRIVMLLAGLGLIVGTLGIAAPAQAVSCPGGCGFDWHVHYLGTNQESDIALTSNPGNHQYRDVSYCESRTTTYKVNAGWVRGIGVIDTAWCQSGSVITDAAIQENGGSTVFFWHR